jgi:oligopeptide transport system permease protein
VARAEAEALGDLRLEDALVRRERGLWSDAFRRLIRNRFAFIALIILVVIAALAIVGNYVDAVQRYEPHCGSQCMAVTDPDKVAIRADPSADHFFGTDRAGRDSWARVLEGLLISLEVGFGVQIFVLAIGLTVGGVAALGGRTLDNIMMRITDVAYAFPDLLFIILLRSMLQNRDLPVVGGRTQEILLMIVAIGFVAWVTIARLVRGQMLSLKERDFVVAARAIGAPQWQIVYRHMLPNTLGPVIVAIVFGIPLAIFAEAVLGYLGIGVSPPTASLGVLIADGYAYIGSQVWLVIFPTATLALLMLCFTFLGDGLRDALDPRSR